LPRKHHVVRKMPSKKPTEAQAKPKSNLASASRSRLRSWRMLRWAMWPRPFCERGAAGLWGSGDQTHPHQQSLAKQGEEGEEGVQAYRHGGREGGGVRRRQRKSSE
jgi:hypothetical protein